MAGVENYVLAQARESKKDDESRKNGTDDGRIAELQIH